MTTWMICEDSGSVAFRPLTWLRPPSGLRLGAETLEERWRRLVAPDPVCVVCRDEVAALDPRRLGWSDLAATDDAIWVSDRFLPTQPAVALLRSLESGRAAVLRGRSVAVRATGVAGLGPSGAKDEAGPTLESRVEAARDSVPVGADLVTGEILTGLGDLIGAQARLLEEDLKSLLEAGSSEATSGSGPVGDGFGYARERIRIDSTARIDHGAVLDARDGGIVLGPGCEVLPGAYLRGPLVASARCLFLGGTVGSGSSFGPVSRVRGEIETTVFLGYANKAHDGFLGHSYVGEWVNLGAMTTTSDLKNDYGEVSLDVAGEKVPTGSNKVGTFFGDHAKTRIGTLFNTGTVVGLGANVFGGGPMAERYLADFQWGTGSDAVEYRLEKFLRVARTVLGRRNVAWTEAYQTALRRAHEGSAPIRARSLSRA